MGIDIDPGRIDESNESAARAKLEGRILPDMDIHFVCGNALEYSAIPPRATVIFLYLIPRGLKQVYPILIDHRKRRGTSIRVITYMSMLPADVKPVGRAVCHVPHQKGAAWPLYFYEL